MRDLVAAAEEVLTELDPGAVAVVDGVSAGVRDALSRAPDPLSAVWAFLCGYEMGRRAPDTRNIVYVAVGQYLKGRVG